MHFVNSEKTLRYYRLRNYVRFCFVLIVAVWVSYQVIFTGNLLDVGDWLSAPSSTVGLTGVFEYSPILAIPLLYILVMNWLKIICSSLYRQAELDYAHREMRAGIAAILDEVAQKKFEQSTRSWHVKIEQTSSDKHPTYHLHIERHGWSFLGLFFGREKTWTLTESRMMTADGYIRLREAYNALYVLVAASRYAQKSSWTGESEWD